MCPSIDGFNELSDFIEAIEKPFWEPIGLYVFRFGMLERKVDEALSSLMGISYFDVGKYTLNEIDFLARAHLLKVFSRNSKSSIEEEMKILTLEIEAQNTFRNNLVHGPWTAHFSNFDGKKNAWQKLGLSRRHKIQAFNVTRDEILSNATKVDFLATEVIRLSRQVLEAKTARAASASPAPSPGKSV